MSVKIKTDVTDGNLGIDDEAELRGMVRAYEPLQAKGNMKRHQRALASLQAGGSRMATPEEVKAASKRLNKQIDENIDVFKRLADK